MNLIVRVVPNSSKTEVVGWMDDGSLKIKLAAPPVDGEANRELVSFLAKSLDIPKSSVDIVNGLTSKKKTLRLPLDANALEKILAETHGIKKQPALF